MHKVLIVSDSHGLTDKVIEIKTRHNVKHMIHCGDSELSYNSSALEGFINVAGNCDYEQRFLEEETIVIGELTFFITHGHLHNVGNGLNRLAYSGAEKDAQVICFGHTHIAGAETMKDQLFINPGSIRSSRNHMEETYAIMNWETLSDIQVTFYDLAGQVVEELSYTTSFI